MRNLAPVVYLSLMLSACTKEEPQAPPMLSRLTINAVASNRGDVDFYDTGNVADVFQQGRDYSLSELTTRYPLTLNFKSTVNGYVKVNGQFVHTNDPVRLDVYAIDAATNYLVEYIDGTGVQQSFRLHTRPKELPSFLVKGKTSVPGVIALTPGGGSSSPYLLLLDGSGEIIFYRKATTPQISDFKKYRINGRTYYSYLAGKPILPIGYFEGKAYVLDRNFSIIRIIDGALPNSSKNRTNIIQSENHDFKLIDRDHYIVSSYYGRAIDGVPGAAGSTMIVGSLIQEVDRNVVVFEWDSTDHPELFAQSEEGNRYSATNWSDYVHCNSIDIDPRDENLIVSFRNLNSIFKIDRRSGEIIWRYGGKADSFGLTGHQLPQGQHFARLTTDFSLTYLDNNTTCIGVPPELVRFFTPNPQLGGQTICDQRAKTSRIVKVRLDEATLKVSGFQEWQMPNPAEVAAYNGNTYESVSYRGSVQQLPNGDLFIGFGSHAAGERDAAELDSQAQPVFELYFDYAGQQPQQSNVSSYRAQFFPD